MKREIFYNSNIPGWVKRADKRSQNCQTSVMKATTGMIKLCHNLLKAEKQSYVVNTKDLSILGDGVNNAAKACKFLHEEGQDQK